VISSETLEPHPALANAECENEYSSQDAAIAGHIAMENDAGATGLKQETSPAVSISNEEPAHHSHGDVENGDIESRLPRNRHGGALPS
jgi:hypothetical protein